MDTDMLVLNITHGLIYWMDWPRLGLLRKGSQILIRRAECVEGLIVANVC